MQLSESLVWALEPFDISGVKVMCDDVIRDEVSKRSYAKIGEAASSKGALRHLRIGGGVQRLR